MVPDDDSVRLLSHELEDLDYSVLYQAFLHLRVKISSIRWSAGLPKVKLEILMLCLGYNLNKLHAKIQNERTNTHFFEVKTA